MKRVYFDHNATTPVDPAVVDAMIPYLREQWGNASSVHEWGKEARYGVEKARRQVANLAQVPEDNLIFTSCGTESNNTVLVSVAKRFASEGCHIITSSIEHPAIYRCLGRLESEGLAEVTYLNPGHNGMVDPDMVGRAIRPDTRLISIMWANNETGALQPIPEIARLARNRDIMVHSDTIQALGKVSLDLEAAGLDFASFSAHKLYGPKGVGGLYFKGRDTILPLLHGGGQEMKLRPGTENVAGAVGFGTAAALSAAAMEEEPERLQRLRGYLENRLTSELEGTYVCAKEASRLPGTLCVCFERVYGTYVVLDLAEEGIAVSSGSACSANKSEPSQVLLAMGIEAQLAQGAVRYSLGRRSTQEEVDLVVEATMRIVEKQRAHPPFQEDDLDLLSICD